MRIVRNQSLYQSRDIARIVRQAVKSHITKEHLANLRVTVKHGRRKIVWGRGSYTIPRIMLTLPAPGKMERMQENLAATAVHEVWHNKGIRHGNMPDGIRYASADRRYISAQTGQYIYEPRYPWAVGLPLRLKAAKAKPTRDEKLDAKLEAALAKVAHWTTRQKMATTKLKLWQRRAKVLGQRQAARPKGE